MVINGGTFNGGSYTAVKNDSFGEMKITGGKFESTISTGGIHECGSALEITGGTFDCPVRVENYASTVGEAKTIKLDGGTFNGKVEFASGSASDVAKAESVGIKITDANTFNSSLSITNSGAPAGTNPFVIEQFDAKKVGGMLTFGGKSVDTPLPALELDGIECTTLTLSYVSPSTLNNINATTAIKCGTVELTNCTTPSLTSNAKNATITVGEGCKVTTVKEMANTGSSIVVDGGTIGTLNSNGKTAIWGYDSITVNSGSVGTINMSKGSLDVKGGTVEKVVIENKFVTANAISVNVAAGGQVGTIDNQRAGNEAATAETTITLPEGYQLAEDGTVQQDISTATISSVSAYYPYSGEAIEPVPTVKIKKNIDGKTKTITLEKDTDYTVEYANNTAKGTEAKVIVKGTGAYFGTVEKTFGIRDAVYEHDGVPSALNFPTSFTSNGTYKLLQDVDLTVSRLTYSVFTKDVTIDLNGHNLNIPGGAGYPAVYVSRAGTSLQVIGEGTITDTTGKAMSVVGVNAANCSVSIGEDVKLVGDFGISVDKNAKAAVVDFDGTIDAASVGLYVNGNITDSANPVIVNVNGTVNSGATGIYGAGYAEWTVAGKIVGDETGIEVRAGKLNVVDGAEITSNAYATKVTPNGNGTTVIGAGVAIAQHTTALPIDVNISGGTISGPVAFLEANPQGNSEEAIAGITASITSGTFNGSSEPVQSEDLTGFISGGTFSDLIDDKYVEEGMIPAENPNGTFGIKEGSFAAKINGIGYESVDEALEALTDDSILVILDNEITELTIDEALQNVKVTNNTENTIKLNGTDLEAGKSMNSAVASMLAKLAKMAEEIQKAAEEKAAAEAERDQAIAERDAAIAAKEAAETAKTEAETARDAAIAAKEAAEAEKQDAVAAKEAAETAKAQAEAAQAAAETAKAQAEEAKAAAEAQRDDALAAKTAAEEAKAAAETAEAISEALAQDAKAERDAAITAKEQAEVARALAEERQRVAEAAKTAAEEAEAAAVQAKEAAEEAEAAAVQAKEAAEAAKTAAEAERDQAIADKNAAIAAKEAAEAARDEALAAKATAESEKATAEEAKAAAETAATAANTAKEQAEAAKTAAEQERDNAVAAQTAAEEAKAAAEAAQATAEALANDATAERDEALAAKTAAEEAKALAEQRQAEAEAAQATAEAAQAAAEAERDQAIAGMGDYGPLPVGTVETVSGSEYVVSEIYVKGSQGTVYMKTAKDAKTVTLPATVVMSDNRVYKVVGISADAFANSKAKTLTVKTKLLTKESVTGSLTGSKVKTVKVKVGKKSVNKKFVTTYKKIFAKANSGKKVSVKR
ncbi:MAG: hypothetical protein Q4A65_05970 [Bacillota bacterium]|nr:hypothetical protein [Bacillota bacterium]